MAFSFDTIPIMKQALIILIALIAGGFLFWAFSPLFIDEEVQDELDPALQARLEAQRQVDERRAQQQEANNEEQPDEKDPEETIDVSLETGIITHGPFSIEDTPSHPATGAIEIIESPEEKLVYFKDYDGTNGPDLRIYLAKDLEANEFIDLGPAKGNKGDIIYGMPLNVDVSEYQYVLTWCKAFGVLFDYAEIN